MKPLHNSNCYIVKTKLTLEYFLQELIHFLYVNEEQVNILIHKCLYLVVSIPYGILVIILLYNNLSSLSYTYQYKSSKIAIKSKILFRLLYSLIIYVFYIFCNNAH